MLQLYLPNRPRDVRVSLRDGDMVGLQNPKPGIWLLMLHGNRDGQSSHFLFKGGDDKRLLESISHDQAVVEIAGLIGPKLGLGRPTNPGPNLWSYPIVKL